MTPQPTPTFAELAARRLSRRAVLGGGAAAALLAAVPALATPRGGADGFASVPHSSADAIRVADGHAYNVVVRWGDPLVAGAPDFDPRTQTAASQAGQLGYNADFVGYLPLPRGSARSDHGLLCISSEYTDVEFMFPDARKDGSNLTRAQCDVLLAAHGLNVVEVRRTDAGRWRPVLRSRRNRRVTGFSPFWLTGPARGHPLLRTSTDPSGTMVVGTLNNCSGGLTPWGTWLQAEEDFGAYFGGDPRVRSDAQRAAFKRYAIDKRSSFAFERFHARFDTAKEPNEPNRFGWVVELDPYRPHAMPVKRTALGRFAHEAATVARSADGHAVVYMGDDGRFEFIYKFVSAGVIADASEGPAANARLLDTGTLYVAHLRQDGTGEWRPLTFGQGPLTPAAGFADQGEVLIHARLAGTALGATPMDRPEDIAVSRTTGHVYVALTNNSRRTPEQANAMNPRGPNAYGHVLEIIEDGGDHAARTFRWEIPLVCGPDPETGSTKDALSCPDNLASDASGRLWIATDGQPYTLGANDAVYVTEMAGPRRGQARRFLTAVPGAEVCGPCFTPDERTFFCAIQHPGVRRDSTYAKPVSRFPDYDPALPPRPSVIAVYRTDGARVGP